MLRHFTLPHCKLDCSGDKKLTDMIPTISIHLPNQSIIYRSNMPNKSIIYQHEADIYQRWKSFNWNRKHFCEEKLIQIITNVKICSENLRFKDSNFMQNRQIFESKKFILIKFYWKLLEISLRWQSLSIDQVMRYPLFPALIALFRRCVSKESFHNFHWYRKHNCWIFLLRNII